MKHRVNLLGRLTRREVIISASVLLSYCVNGNSSPPSGPLLYTVSNVPGEWQSRREAIAEMKGVSAATARFQLNDKETNPDTGLVTEYWGPAEAEVAPNVGSFEWSVAYCVPVYGSVCAGFFASQSDLMTNVGSGIEALEGCSPVTWEQSSGWYWNSFTVAGLSDPYLIHANKDWTLQIPSGTTCASSKETTLKILARRDADCEDGFDGPSEVELGSPYWSCRNNQSATLQYYSTEETSPCAETVGNPCDVATGAKIEKVVDYESSGLTFYRTYRSNILMPGVSLHGAMLGPNWTHNYLSAIHWDLTGAVPERLYRPDGGFISLELLSTNVWVAKNGSGIQIRDADPGNYTSDWIVYLPSGAREVYAYYTFGTQIPQPQWRLTELHDPQGRVTTISYSAQSSTRVAAVIGPFGHRLQFEYSTVFLGYQTRTRLDYIQDPAGNKIDFVYDDSSPATTGNVLTSVIYQDQSEVRYLYSSGTNLAPFQLVGIVDENDDQYASFEYDEHERVKSTQHDGGYGYLLLEYNDVNFTTTVTDADWNKTIYSFQGDSLGVRNPAVITYPDGSTIEQGNEAAGQRRLAYMTDEKGNTTLYEYNNYHRVAKKEAYDLVQGTSLRETSYSYLNDTSDLRTATRSASVTDCNLTVNLKATSYISDTQLVSAYLETGFDPTDCSQLSRLTTLSDYNAFGQARKVDGPRGVDANGFDDITTIEYYECSTGGQCGHIRRIINALGHEINFLEYDEHGRLKKKTDPNGVLTDYTYDLRGRINTISANVAGGIRVTNFDYDAAGQIGRIITPGGLILDYVWNSAHLLESVIDNHGNRTDYRYDSRGNRTGEDLRDPNGLMTKAMAMAYDKRNRLDTLQSGSGSVSNFGFDAAGYLQLSVDPNANNTEYNYDDLSRLINIIDALNGASQPTEFGFNLNDNLTSLSAPNGALTTYQYNDFGDLLREISPDRGTTLYAYDSAGNMTCKADARARSLLYARCDDVPDRWVYTYDALNRPDTIDYLITPGLDVDYDYDQGVGQQGRLSQVIYESDAGLMVENQYTYDLLGNLTEHRQVIPDAGNVGQSYTTSYQHDDSDRITRMTYPSGRVVDYLRNDLGQIIEITTTSPAYYQTPLTTTLISNVAYYPFGPPKRIVYGNGLDQNRLLDDAYRPASLQLSNAEEILETKVYTTDAVGNILQIADQQGGTEVSGYSYDQLNRLVWDASIDSTPSTPTYTYDANGNRLTRELDASVANQTIEYAPDSNTMTSFNAANVFSDQAGNITNNGAGMVAGYNAANRLGWFYKNGTTLSMLYNGIGELVKTTAKASCSCGFCPKVYEYFHFLPDGRALSMTQDSSYKITVDWIWLDGLPVAQIQEGFLVDGTHDPSSTEITFLTSDHLGTPRLGTDSSGQEVWRMQSDAFGRSSITTSGPVVRLRFPGQIDYGYAGVYYNYYRDYDSNTGRYLESDPIGLRGGNNPYIYVSNRPANLIDPNGLIEWTGFSTGASASFVFGASFYVYELTSECVNGKRAEATVFAVGPTLGAGITAVSASLGAITLNDNRSTIDPSVLNGRFALRSIGVSGAGIGGSAYQLVVGGSHTSLVPDGATGADLDLFLGVDIGVNITQGSSTVGDVKWRDCLDNACDQ